MPERGMAARSAEAAETFSFTMALVVPVGELRAWFEAAAPRDKSIYATGFVLPREAESVAQVTRWVEAGEVRTFQRRDPLDARRWQFLIERAETASSRARMIQPDLTARQLVALHQTLVEAAAAGEPCPTRAALAREVTGQDSERAQRRVRWLMERLEAEGRIALTRAPIGAQHGPKVTILTGKHQGKSTAWPVRDNSERGE